MYLFILELVIVNKTYAALLEATVVVVVVDFVVVVLDIVIIVVVNVVVVSLFVLTDNIIFSCGK